MNHDAHGIRLVSKVLDDKELVVGDDRRRGALLMDVLNERLSCGRITLVFVGDARNVVFAARLIELSSQRADARREMRRARRVLAVPEGHPRRRAGCGRHDHAIMLDRVHPPR